MAGVRGGSTVVYRAHIAPPTADVPLIPDLPYALLWSTRTRRGSVTLGG
jgi:hypothetical protein